MARFSRTIIIFLQFLLWLSLFHKDSSAETATEEIQVVFSVLPLNKGDWENIFYAPRGNIEREAVPLKFNPLERSQAYSYQGSPDLIFYIQYRSAEGEAYYKAIGQIALNHDITQTLILVEQTQEPETQRTCKLHLVPDDPLRFPSESLVFFNTLPVTFHGVLGQQAITLRPGLNTALDVSPYFQEPAPIGLVVQDGDRKRKVLVTQIKFDPQRRTLLILRKPSRPGSFRIQTQRLTEYSKPAAKIAHE